MQAGMKKVNILAGQIQNLPEEAPKSIKEEEGREIEIKKPVIRQNLVQFLYQETKALKERVLNVRVKKIYVRLI